MGTVYAAHDQVVDETIAIKVLALPRDQSIERFRREVRLARKVTHRNAARTFDLLEFQGVHFITMELVEGESLQARLARHQRLAPEQVIALGVQIARGLAAAHEVGVLHRDLKPGNVLVERSGRAAITDFGVACTIAEGQDGSDDPPPLDGTPLYMAPEQVIGAPIDARADLYALGLLLFELLVGQPPFPGDDPGEAAEARIGEDPPDPRTRAEVPDALAELVLRCLARDPATRPASAAQIAQALAELGGDEDTPGASADPAGVAAPLGAGEISLAVLPFRFRGPPEEAFLAEVLCDELIDLLAMTRGLRVSTRGATSHEPERSTKAVGEMLGVDAIIEGNIQCQRSQLRIMARLVDVESGFVRWNDRFEGYLEDVLSFQGRMAKRIAEALRLELSMRTAQGTLPREVVALYLEGRKTTRTADIMGFNFEDAIDLFDRALALAPGFSLALAARADATVQRWFLASSEGPPNWAELSRQAVAEALEGAQELAETHLAAARLAVGEGEISAAVRHLGVALEIAPTYAAAHEYLGQLQCDAGRSAEGVKHIRLAQDLDPTLHQGQIMLLRHYALRGRWNAYERSLARLRLASHLPRFVLNVYELRVALWRGDAVRARDLRWENHDAKGPMDAELVRLVQDSLRPESGDAELGARFKQMLGRMHSPRMRTIWRQISVELFAWRGNLERALEHLATVDADSVLLDTDWFDYCPLLGDLASSPQFAAVRQRVRDRAEAIWRSSVEG